MLFSWALEQRKINKKTFWPIQMKRKKFALVKVFFYSSTHPFKLWWHREETNKTNQWRNTIISQVYIKQAYCIHRNTDSWYHNRQKVQQKLDEQGWGQQESRVDCCFKASYPVYRFNHCSRVSYICKNTLRCIQPTVKLQNEEVLQKCRISADNPDQTPIEWALLNLR